MKYDLAAMARQAGVRKNRVMRPIRMPTGLQRSLYAIAVKPVLGWKAQIEERVLPGYARALSSLTQDDEADDIAELIRMAQTAVDGVTSTTSAEVEGWLREALRWHEAQWAASVQSGSMITSFPFVDQLGGSPRIKAYSEQISGLIKDISTQSRKEVEQTVWRGFTNGTPRKEMGKELAERLDIPRKRANLIAIDQSQKLNGEMTGIRMQEAGLTHYEWRHSGKVHFRKEHKARNGKVYKLGQPEGDQPGDAIFCGCIRMPIIDVEETLDDTIPGAEL